MNNHYEMNDQNLDNRLADFVDELLGGKSVESPPGQGIDLDALQDTVIKLKMVLVEDLPSVEMSKRIQRNLAAEWGKQKTAAKTQTSPVENWLKLFRDRFNLPSLTAPRNFAWSFATVAVLILVALLLLNPDFNNDIAGTALGQASWIPVVVIIVGVVALGLIWFFRSRR
jgi:hypothetical protein